MPYQPSSQKRKRGRARLWDEPRSPRGWATPRVGLEDRWPVLVLSTVVSSAGALSLVHLVLSRLAADTPRRFAPLVVNAWFLLGNLANFVPDMVGREPSSGEQGLLMLACVGCAAVAVGTVFLWRRRERGFIPVGSPASS